MSTRRQRDETTANIETAYFYWSTFAVLYRLNLVISPPGVMTACAFGLMIQVFLTVNTVQVSLTATQELAMFLLSLLRVGFFCY